MSKGQLQLGISLQAIGDPQAAWRLLDARGHLRRHKKPRLVR
jgi:hypothetical protein